MKNRQHTPKKTITLRQICRKGNIPFPIEESYSIKLETGANQKEDIIRNFPNRSYSTKSTNPWEIVCLLAYEAHEWQACEIIRHKKIQEKKRLSTLLHRKTKKDLQKDVPVV